VSAFSATPIGADLEPIEADDNAVSAPIRTQSAPIGVVKKAFLLEIQTNLRCAKPLDFV
jgi:hypothetical protein